MQTINKETLGFLNDLRDHNDRDWFTKNKPKYELAKDNAKAFATELMEEMRKHDHIEGLKVFRIYQRCKIFKR